MRGFEAGLWGLAIALVVAAPAHAEDRWVESEGSAAVAPQVVPDEAKRMAIYQARTRAIGMVTGTTVSDHVTQVRRDGNPVRMFHEMRMATTGTIVEETVLGWKTELVPDGTETPITRYTVRLRVRVALGQAAKAPFQVSLELPRASLISGDALTMTIRATQPVHLCVFNLAADDRVYPLFPNAYTKFLVGSPWSPLTLPAPDSDFVLRPRTLPGHAHDVEAIKVIATREQVLAPPTTPMTLAAFYAWLMTIPPEDRAEATADYVVHRETP